MVFRITGNFITLVKNVENFPLVILMRFGLIKGNYSILNLRNGFRLKIRPKTTDYHEVINVIGGKNYNFKLYENLLKEKSTVVNIGAHIGTFELYLKSRKKNLRIYSFEPESSNFELLNENLKLNNIKDVYTINKAVSDSQGTKYLVVDDIGKNEGYLSNDKGLPVKTTTLDLFIKETNLHEAALLKMDCEGSEYSILETSNSIKIFKAVIMEYHTKNTVYNKHWVINFMEKNGFVLSYAEICCAKDACGILFFTNNR